MKIRVSVYATVDQLSISCLYSRDFEWIESVAFPFDIVCKTLKLLYPSACCVTFNIIK